MIQLAKLWSPAAPTILTSCPRPIFQDVRTRRIKIGNTTCLLSPSAGGSTYVVYHERKDGALQPLGRVQRFAKGRRWRYEGSLDGVGFGTAWSLHEAVEALCS